MIEYCSCIKFESCDSRSRSPRRLLSDCERWGQQIAVSMCWHETTWCDDYLYIKSEKAGLGGRKGRTTEEKKECRGVWEWINWMGVGGERLKVKDVKEHALRALRRKGRSHGQVKFHLICISNKWMAKNYFWARSYILIIQQRMPFLRVSNPNWVLHLELPVQWIDPNVAWNVFSTFRCCRMSVLYLDALTFMSVHLFLHGKFSKLYCCFLQWNILLRTMQSVIGVGLHRWTKAKTVRFALMKGWMSVHLFVCLAVR